jgi:tRNA/tmRNA/rRNA uracil-C5-methylase (TrmA/RlmC/RlmD family)
MKLRLDLLKHLTAEDIAEAAEESVHRFKPEPLFSQTGTGSLSSASTEERVREVEHSTELTRKLEERARNAGNENIRGN